MKKYKGNSDRRGVAGKKNRRGEQKSGSTKRFKKPRNQKFKTKDRFDFKPSSGPKIQRPSALTSEAVIEGPTRLNKYLANAGICSRREADKFIEAGVVSVNGKVITEMGFKVNPGDKVLFGGAGVKKEKTIYILMNKPKGYLTTCDDPMDRQTVLDIIPQIKERVYPIGRLDRNTSGLLILTNDGDLAKVLMHPKYKVPKIYHVVLDKALTAADLEAIRNGIHLEDGLIKPDDIAWVDGSITKKDVGIEIHSGRNRIVRRIFEHLGYQVEKLDRVVYAGLTKKNLPRGKWRFLEEKEVRFLKKRS